jgi:hypothetical protein
VNCLQHDTAFALATALLEIVKNCIRPEERRDAFGAFYEACKGALECYDTMKGTEGTRLRPSRN